MLQDTDYYSYLICPFTGRKLRFLSDQELETVNERIGRGELYFHPGIQVVSKLTQAVVTEHQTYIYPVIDGVFYLKRETAIVAKNRTENYLKRISQSLIDAFEGKYGFNKSKEKEAKVQPDKVDALNPALIGSLRTKLSKRGKYFVSLCTNDIDALHNLVFETKYEQYIHVEFEFERLKSITADIKEKTVLILADNGKLPFEDGSLDALVSFDPINKYTKVDQKVIYSDFKRALNVDAASVVLYENDKPLHTKFLLGADKLSTTARGLVMPWKKVKIPTFHFEGINPPRATGSSNEIVGQTSLNQQFS